MHVQLLIIIVILNVWLFVCNSHVIPILVHQDYVLNITFLESTTTIADLIHLTYQEISDQLASERTNIVDLRLNEASLFHEDIALAVIGAGEVPVAIYGFKYEIYPPSLLVSNDFENIVPSIISLYHDSTNEMLLTSIQMKNPWEDECQNIIDISVTSKNKNDERSSMIYNAYPTLKEQSDSDLTSFLPHRNDWQLVAVCSDDEEQKNAYL
jgi:hypothetical protein